jgi:putative transposase
MGEAEATTVAPGSIASCARRGIRVGRKRIERLMRERGLKGAQKHRFHCTTDSRHSLPMAANLLDRTFDPTEVNRVCAGDVTYIVTDQGWLYLAVIRDRFSRCHSACNRWNSGGGCSKIFSYARTAAA